MMRRSILNNLNYKKMKDQKEKDEKKLEKSLTVRGMDMEIDFWLKFLDSGLFDFVFSVLAAKLILDIYFAFKRIEDNFRILN